MSTFSFSVNVTPTTEIYTLSLHDALPIYLRRRGHRRARPAADRRGRHPPRDLLPPRDRERRPRRGEGARAVRRRRSEEHTSELQSHVNLVCRLLLEKKNK